MGLPKKVTIGGFDWAIESNIDIAAEGQVFGSTHYRTLKIFIDPLAPVQKQEQTLLHEIIHACVWQCGLNRRFDNKEVVSEEDVVHSLSMTLYPVLKKLGYLKGENK
jgi:hypothetical protein